MQDRMKWAPWLALLVLLAPPAQAASTISFASPAQVQGDLNATGVQWVLLVFHGADAAQFRVRAEGDGVATNHTVAVWEPHYSGVFDGRPASYPLPNRTAAWRGPLDAEMRFGREWSSLYVAADSIQISLAETAGNLLASTPPQTMDEHFPPGTVPQDGSYRVAGHDAEGGVAFGIKPLAPGALAGFRLAASGLRMLEWHNAELRCAEACLDGAGSLGASRDDPVGSNAVHLMFFQELQVDGGTLEGAGRAWAVAAGGHTLNLGLRGSGRFPQSSIAGPCQACPDADQTLRLEGSLDLVGLHGEQGHLAAEMRGTLTAARLDEASLPPALLFAAGAGTAGLVVVALWGVGVWLGLFSRLDHGHLSARRRATLDAIQGNPGINAHQLASLTGQGHSTVRYQIHRLKLGNFVVERSQGRAKCFFAADQGRLPGEAVVLLREEAVAQLLAWILANPGNTAARAAERAQAGWGWSPSTTHHRVGRLIKAGLLLREPDTRHGTLRASDLAAALLSQVPFQAQPAGVRAESTQHSA